MRITIRLDDALVRKAKKFAAKNGRTLSLLMSDALRQLMARSEEPRPRKKLDLPVFRGGGLQPGVDLDNNEALRDLMDGLSDHVQR